VTGAALRRITIRLFANRQRDSVEAYTTEPAYMGEPTAAAGLPAHFEKEWAETRQLINQQDERVHDTRKMVFGLFSSLATVSGFFSSNVPAAGRVWPAVHLALLGLLVTGRFIEQQAGLLQKAAVSRAFVLELLTPIELTDTLSARYRRGWAQRTTYIYVALGLVSTVVFGLLSGGGAPLLAIAAVTGLYVAYVAWIGRLDLTFAREGQDWSFSATSCQVGEVISILLTNLADAALLPTSTPAALRRIYDADGKPVHGPCENLPLHPEVLDVGRSLPNRRPFRWLWKAPVAGLWVLEVAGPTGGFARRCIHVLPSAAPGQSERGVWCHLSATPIRPRRIT
jgi:hypothetical protein